MTHKVTSISAILSLFIIILAITACDSTPAPGVITPVPVGLTNAPPTPDAPTPEIFLTATVSEIDTPIASEASPTEEESVPPPVPTDTSGPVATATRKATATAKTPARATVLKPTLTPGATAGTTQGESTYVFPVQPPDVTTYGQAHHDYPATDIFCPQGSKFVAPIDGVVDYVSYKDIWDPAVDDPASRGGLSVAIIGVDDVRYYGSHLSKIAEGISPGVEVQAGDLLGRTGKTGDARFVDPHLHFGISHPTTPDDWEVRRGEISPYKYLKAWQVGKNLKPVFSP